MKPSKIGDFQGRTVNLPKGIPSSHHHPSLASGKPHLFIRSMELNSCSQDIITIIIIVINHLVLVLVLVVVLLLLLLLDNYPCHLLITDNYPPIPSPSHPPPASGSPAAPTSAARGA